jgi:hypothetical protein
MKKAKRNLILVMALLMAGALIFFIERPFDRKGGQADGDLLVFPDFEPWKVNKILVGNGTLTFENRDGNWFLITAARPYPADRNQIGALLQAIRELKRDNIASENEEKQSLFGVKAGEGTEVVAYDVDGKKIVDFFVGKKGPDGLSAYVRRADAEEVILQPGNLRDHLDKPEKLWRDRKVFTMKAAEVVQITLQVNLETIVLNRDTKGGWFIVKPVSQKADGGRIEQMLTVLNDLEASDFAEQMKPAEAGLVTPQMRLSVRLKDRTTKMLLIGQPANEWGYYAMAGEGQSIIILQSSVLGILFPQVEDLEVPVVAAPEKE